MYMYTHVVPCQVKDKPLKYGVVDVRQSVDEAVNGL